MMLSFGNFPGDTTFHLSAASLDPATIVYAVLVAHLQEGMRDVPQHVPPEAHLAMHLAALTEQHITFLYQETSIRDVPCVPQTTPLSMAVRYGLRHFGQLYWDHVPDESIAAAHAFLAHLAHICGQALFLHYAGTLVREVDGEMLEALPQRLARLSEREGVTFRHLAHGKSAEDIAALQKIGLGTVRTHLQKIYAKLEVEGQLQAAITGAVAQMLGLLR